MIIDFQEQYVKRGLMKLGMNKEDLEEYDTDKFGDDMIRALQEVKSRKRELEEKFYNFTRTEVKYENTFIFGAFITEMLQNIIDILDEEGGEDLETTLKYLNELKITLVNTATKKLLFNNMKEDNIHLS